MLVQHLGQDLTLTGALAILEPPTRAWRHVWWCYVCRGLPSGWAAACSTGICLAVLPRDPCVELWFKQPVARSAFASLLRKPCHSASVILFVVRWWLILTAKFNGHLICISILATILSTLINFHLLLPFHNFLTGTITLFSEEWGGQY